VFQGVIALEGQAWGLANTPRTPPRASLVLRICRHPCRRAVRGTTAAAPARAVAGPAHVTAGGGAPCTRSAACAGTGRASCVWPTPSTTAALAASSSAPTCRTWPRRAATTPTGSSAWRCGWWRRTACRTGWPPGTCGATTASSSPSPPCRTGSRRRGEKADAQTEADHLDWALADFSGYLAADELYDGPFCVLSAVDARQQRRLLYEVLDRAPTQVDILLFMARLHDRIRAHGHAALGITTDGSPLYPQPIALVLRGVPHQVRQFHILH